MVAVATISPVIVKPMRFRYSRAVPVHHSALGTASKYADYLRRARGGGLSYLIFFITSRCRGGCGHCFNRSRLNADDDLSFAEIQRVSATAGPLGALLLSGGEPFLREELVEIVSLFVEQNGVVTCAIPTSGDDPRTVVQATDRLLQRCPRLHLAVSPSVDGPAALNDELRYPGSFRAAHDAVRGLLRLRHQHPGLEVVAHTVLQRRNAEALPELLEEVAGWGVTGHSVELIRDPSLLPQPGALPRLHRLVLRNRARYLRSPLERLAILGSLSLAQRTKERSLAGHPFRCVAGRQVGVLDADGGLQACELLPPVGNVRDFDCDLQAAWQALAPVTSVREMPARCRGCTHVCFINASLASDPLSLLRIPVEYLSEYLLSEVGRER